MALIPIYHVVASSVPVDPGSADIKEGQFVCWSFETAHGYTAGAGVRRIDGANDSADLKASFGIAGDNKSTSGSSMPGIYSGWQNRVSDSFDETKASAKITVYHGGGEFWTDQFDNATALDSSKLGYFLKLTNAGLLTYDGAAKTDASVAQLIGAAGSAPSGVPGTTTGLNGDMALKGDAARSNYTADTYIKIRLLV